MINAIFAIDDQGGIGFQGKLPWKPIAEDFNWFRKHTMHHVVVMGRATWESLPFKPLPHRINIVVSTSLTHVPGCDQVISRDIINHLQQLEKRFNNKIVWIIGGSALLSSTLPAVDYVYLTRVPGTYQCDTSIDAGIFQSESNFELLNTEHGQIVTFEIWKNSQKHTNF